MSGHAMSRRAVVGGLAASVGLHACGNRAAAAPAAELESLANFVNGLGTKYK